MTTSTDNAIHAAATWLQRLGADPATVVVVNVKPTAAVGTWAPGATNVRVWPGVDDAMVELFEAIAPAVQEGLELIGDDALTAVMDRVAIGAQLQALVAPTADEISIRVIHGGRVVTIAVLVSTDAVH